MQALVLQGDTEEIAIAIFDFKVEVEVENMHVNNDLFVNRNLNILLVKRFLNTDYKNKKTRDFKQNVIRFRVI